MNDMLAVIVPKSDQINADSLLGAPITITITDVTIRPGTEQPVSIHFEGDNGKPYKCCKSMARVLVHCWGADANQYKGRSLTLYCDPKVKWGGLAVGGIRISHMSHITASVTMALTETKGSKKPFTVKPIIKDAPKQSVRDIVRSRCNAATTEDEITAIETLDVVKTALAKAPDEVKTEINDTLAAARARIAEEKIAREKLEAESDDDEDAA